jgi:hypothetical protein
MRSLLGLGVLLLSINTFAFTHSMAPSLPREILSETVPFTFAPNGFSAGDFEAYWQTQAPSGSRAFIGAESFEWVRASEVFLLPRGRLIVELDGAGIEAARIQNLGFTQSFVRKEGRLHAEIPVALMSGESNPIRVITLGNNGKETESRIGIRFKPRPEVMEQRVITDPACSPYRVKAEELQLKDHQWVYVGCRFVVSQGNEHRTSTLEIFVYWEGAPQQLLIDGMEVKASTESVWMRTQRAAPGELSLVGSGEKLKLNYRIAENLHSGSLGFGIGPYGYAFEAPGSESHNTIPLLTIYGSYFYSETLRIVGFNATAFDKNYFSDTGLYVQTEQFKIFDKRYTMRLLLGAHAIAFNAMDKSRFIFGAPQGAELTITDFWKKTFNLQAGSFLFPPINGKSYYNLWLRYGTNRFFGELNYIGWQERVEGERVFSRSVGVTVGGPLFQFL